MSSPHAATPDEMAELVSGTPTDDPWWFTFDDVTLEPHDIEVILGPMLTDERKARMERVLDRRTENVAVVVEGMVDLGNVGAVMRSADGFGVHRFHAIDTAGAYKRSRRSSQGADKWLDRHRWEDAKSCVEHLHGAGYTVVVADADPSSPSIDDTDLTGRIAVSFGNELQGISDRLRAIADTTVTIPLAGFVESLNISVAAAVTLHEIRRQRIERFGSHGDLAAGRRDQIRAVWYLRSVRRSRLVVERALADGYRSAAT